MKYISEQPAKSKRITVVIFVALSLLLLGGGIAVIRRQYYNSLKPYSSSQNSQLVTIAKGASVTEIANDLAEKKIIRTKWGFEWYVRNKNVRDKLQAGTYSLKPSQSIPEIVDVITRGAIATDLVTILPGKRLDEIRDGLINSGFAPDSVDAALNPALYTDHPALVDKPPQASLEGYLYPESFQKVAETQPETIIRASLDEMHKYLSPQLRAAIIARGLTIHQGVTMASVIGQEVSKPEDKAKVAQVFYKRLSMDMLLQSDPTAKYGAIMAGQEPSLSYDSPFNTYKHKGLPPGPISNVNISSLEAVANPAGTDYLYFVAGDDGTTHFSRTLSEHEALTEQYCTKLCR